MKINEVNLLDKIGGEFNNILLTGRVGIGKTETAYRFAQIHAGQKVIYFDGHSDDESGKLLSHDLSFAKYEIEFRKENPQSEPVFLIIDEVQRFEDKLKDNEDFVNILKDGKEVGVFVILITQAAGLLQKFSDDIMNKFIKVEMK